jgi:hypothetical protein
MKRSSSLAETRRTRIHEDDATDSNVAMSERKSEAEAHHSFWLEAQDEGRLPGTVPLREH